MTDAEPSLTAPIEAEPIPPPRPSDETVAGLAFELIRAQYWTMRAHEPTVRGADDPEDLHRMRIAIRRLRAALAVFEDALPARARTLRERLGRVGALLGAVRDFDVQLEQMGTWAAQASAAERDTIEGLAVILEDRRGLARKRVVTFLGSAGFRRLLDSLELFLSRDGVRRSVAARSPVTDLAPELIRREHRKVLTLGDHIEVASPPEALHALRTRCKRLRYAVEFLEPAYGRPARAYVRRLTAVQDVLGSHQDAVAAAAMLRAVALDERRRLDPVRMLAMGAMIERYGQQAVTARERFPKRYRKIIGSPWRKLTERMDGTRAIERGELEPEGDAG